MKKEKETQKAYIGIDVSQLTIDVSIITPQGMHDYQQFENNMKDFRRSVGNINKFYRNEKSLDTRNKKCK